MEPLQNLSGAAQAALERLLQDPADHSAISAFQRSLRPLVSPREDGVETQVSRPVAAAHRIEIDDSVGVQTGNDSHMTVKAKYVAEEMVLPLTELLIENADGALREHLWRCSRRFR